MIFSKMQYARALAELTDCFLEKHGCFPLDNARWKNAMSTAYTLIGQPKTEARIARMRDAEERPKRRFNGRDFIWLCVGIYVGAMGTVGAAWVWSQFL